MNAGHPRNLPLVLIVICALGGAAVSGPGEMQPASGAPAPKPGWLRMSKSLLYYDAEGALSGEIGLGRWEEANPTRVHVKVMDGGTSPDNRFAWTLEKRTSWNAPKTKILDSQRVLRFFASNGKELWSEENPDFVPGSAPLVFSQDGEVCLLALRRKEGWFAAVKTYLGNTLWEVGPFPRLEALQISSNGLYGLARWNEPDKSAVHSFLDINGRARQDVASDRFFLGKAAVDDLGRAYSGQELVFSFSPPAVSTAAPGSEPAAPAGGKP